MRHASCPEGQGRLTAALQVAPDALASSLALRKLVCPSGSRVPCPVGAASQVPDPQPLRRGLHDKQSPLFSTTPPALRPSSPPAAVTVPACKLLAGNKRLCSGPRGGRARLSHAARPAQPPRAGTAPVADDSPPPPSTATAAAPPGQPPWKPGSARRGLRGRRTGAGPTGSPAGKGGGGGKDWRLRRRGRGLPGLGRRTPEHPAPPVCSSLSPHPWASESPCPRG